MQKIVLATGNQGKVAELHDLLTPLQVEVIPQTELHVSDADETGLTFVENALIKARHAAALTGLPALADDSGLAVDALHGAPGIYSARYAGPDATDRDNVDKLLAALSHVPPAKRTASFHCVLVFLRHATDPTPLICHGQWHGSITSAIAGDGGFGYDPIFYVASEHCTAAQLPKDKKRVLSHRGQALQQLLPQLADCFQR